MLWVPSTTYLQWCAAHSSAAQMALTPILQMGRLRHRAVDPCARQYPARKWWSWNLNSSSLASALYRVLPASRWPEPLGLRPQWISCLPLCTGDDFPRSPLSVPCGGSQFLRVGTGPLGSAQQPTHLAPKTLSDRPGFSPQLPRCPGQTLARQWRASQGCSGTETGLWSGQGVQPQGAPQQMVATAPCSRGPL